MVVFSAHSQVAGMIVTYELVLLQINDDTDKIVDICNVTIS